MKPYSTTCSVALALCVLLSGCSVMPHTPLVQGATSAMPVVAPVSVTNGAIFQTGQAMNSCSKHMLPCSRPRNIGDTLTILLQ